MPVSVRKVCVCAASAWLLCLAATLAAQTSPWRPHVSLQTGFATNFQLTLGGTFGQGPAWQNRLTVDFPGVFHQGDALMVHGWMTLDTPTRRRDWVGGAAYRLPALRRGEHFWQTTAGWQRWVFPSVCGARDHLIAVNSVYRTKWKLPLVVTADNWTHLSSTLRKGSLLYVQGNVAHELWKSDAARLVLRHGPSTTYSWHFYNKNGWRVVRYGGSLALETRSWSLEGAYRQQAAIAQGIPDNRYWSVLLTRRF